MKPIIPELIGMGELQRETAQTIRKIGLEQHEAFIVSHNKPRAVLMGLRRYKALIALEEARAREEAEVQAVVAAGDDEFARGKTVSRTSLKTLL